MLTQGQRIMLAALIASAIGLSCAGCLGTSSLQSQSSPAAFAHYQDAADPSLLRTEPSVSRYQPADHTQHQQLQQSFYNSYAGSDFSAHTPVHPTGSISGLDIAISEFAQANSNTQIIRADQQWVPQDRRKIALDHTFVANQEATGLGVDLAVQPRLSIATTGGARTTRAGAEIRVGPNLDKRGQNVKNSNWYLFAGADGEAVVWDVNRAGSAMVDSQLSLQDRVTVGDIQAGVAWESPAGQMSFSYIEREYEYRNGEIARSGDENFVALTLSWKH